MAVPVGVTFNVSIDSNGVNGSGRALPPASAPVSLAKARNFPNPGTGRNCLDVRQFADDLETRDPCSPRGNGRSNRKVRSGMTFEFTRGTTDAATRRDGLDAAADAEDRGRLAQSQSNRDTGA